MPRRYSMAKRAEATGRMRRRIELALTDAGRFTVPDAVEFILGVLDRCLLK